MLQRLRIATYNVENLDFPPAGANPSLDERKQVMQPQLNRVNADVLCLQEVHGQAGPTGQLDLLALNDLIQGTRYETYHRVSTTDGPGGPIFGKRNLVILSRFPIASSEQLHNTKLPAPKYRKVTEIPPAPAAAKEIGWERPVQHAVLDLGAELGPTAPALHVINLHLKSKIPTSVKGQQAGFGWLSASGWAEGYFLSSMKRVGQALETRFLVDEIFDGDRNAWIVVCGDFNADNHEVPVKAILGEVEDTNNGDLAPRALVACERTIPEQSRFSHIHRGRGNMIDHLLISRPMLSFYRHTEVHNEVLHDESVAFATDDKFPESDHAPIVSEFELSTP